MKNFLNLLIILYLSLAGGIVMSAQDSTYSRMKTEVRQLFDDRKYESALPIYRELLYHFPKEPEYQFGTAVCLVSLNRDPGEAISLLRAVNTSGYNPMSYYYLGRMLHRGYLFEDAIKAYSRFILVGKSADVRALDVERLIEMAKNGMEYTRTGRNFRVLEVKSMQADQLEKASDINGSGKLVRKPVEFCSKNDLKEGYRPLMYLPVYTEMNDYVFTSGYEKYRKDLKQIYRVRNINHETWGIPEPLNEVINTAYDDEFPYFDTRTSVLYFSSKGHSSMGGYDIFRSVYNWNTKSWSQPENMGFPINSPDDDFFYMTDEFSQTASFVSDRNTNPGLVSQYKIRITQDTSSIRLASIDEIQNASRLQIESTKAPVVNPNTISPEISHPSEETGIPKSSRNDYNKVLADALTMQLKSDSLGRIVRDKRLTAKETPDEELKKQLVTDIIRTDKESKKLQRDADLKFSEARNMKGKDMGMVAEDPALVMTKEVNNTRVYSYNTETLPPEIENGTTPDDSPELPLPAPDAPPVSRDEFRVTDKSPYGPANPIPKGLNTHNGLVYRIQLGAFSKPRPNDAFGGIGPVCYEQVNNTSILKYYAGLFYSLNGVTTALEQVKKKGFPDAFIVAFLDGKMISTEKARELEFAEMKL